jgi:hypothetical protein
MIGARNWVDHLPDRAVLLPCRTDAFVRQALLLHGLLKFLAALVHRESLLQIELEVVRLVHKISLSVVSLYPLRLLLCRNHNALSSVDRAARLSENGRSARCFLGSLVRRCWLSAFSDFFHWQPGWRRLYLGSDLRIVSLRFILLHISLGQLEHQIELLIENLHVSICLLLVQ